MNDSAGRGWDAVKRLLAQAIDQSGKSLREVAAEIDISPGALSMLLSGRTKEPHPSNLRKIEQWIERRAARRRLDQVPAAESVEAEFLAYLLQHFDQLATFMTTSMERLDPEDRRKMALAILTGLKELALEAGETIPPELFEIERRFLTE